MSELAIHTVVDGPRLDEARELLAEYGRVQAFCVCFQSYEQELRDLPGAMRPPRGKLLLAHWNGAPAGCVGLQPLGRGAGEVRRLYVRPEFRGHGIGRALVERLAHEARELGYRELKLHTLAQVMVEAHALYKRLGFRPCEAYDDAPPRGAVFMELALARDGRCPC